MRNKTIDFLRGIAILLTLFRHFGYSGTFEVAKKIGWIGVDLFFVLSGFLVSGLIFDEYEKTNKFDGKRFLIRRGFKIYPAFWILIIFSSLYQYLFFGNVYWDAAIRQLLFIQNYFPKCDHTWSLAIEEHFYFLIVILFLLIIKYTKNQTKTILIGSITIIIYGIIAKASMFFLYPEYATHTHLFPTHLRIDSLMIGLLIAHVSRKKPEIINSIIRHKYIMYIVAIIALSTPFIWDIDKYPSQLYLSSFGVSAISISFGLILILWLNNKDFTKSAGKIIGNTGFNIITKIGFYSYSIYLWHLMIKSIMYNLLWLQGNTLNGYIVFVLYIVLTIGFGILLGKTIEIPFLKLRDRYFPKKHNII
jgi:peptidoglycan/LPS O-acetylase OafA/YrhL